MGIGFSMYSVIMGHLGTDAVAANGIANISKSCCMLLPRTWKCRQYHSGKPSWCRPSAGSKRGRRDTYQNCDYCRNCIRPCPDCLIPIYHKNGRSHPDSPRISAKMLLISSYYIAGKSVNCMTIGGIFAAGGDSKFGMLCDSVTLWCIIVPLGCICAFILKLPVMVVYFVLNLDEIIKLPVVYKHYKKYKWIKNLT